MDIKTLKIKRPLKISNDKSLGIQCFGENNEYPQLVSNIITNSTTGSECLSIYAKFLMGQGFNDISFSDYIINRQGLTMDSLLRNITKDYAKYGGFALHFNYNALFEISEINFIPFEQVRLGSVDDNGNISKIATHWDWGREMQSLRAWRKQDVTYYDLFNTNPLLIKTEIEQAGGIEEWNGQILYYNGNINLSYKKPIYSAVLTDMNTEEGLANIDNRNARNRFMVGGMLVEIKKDNANTEEQEPTNMQEQLLEAQGDERACKVLYGKVENKDDVPIFIPFQTKSFSDEYKITKESVSNNIGKAFMQPPILRAENVSTGFDTDAMNSAYTYYNSITEVERFDIERVIKLVFSFWKEKDLFNDFSIKPLQWNAIANMTAPTTTQN